MCLRIGGSIDLGGRRQRRTVYSSVSVPACPISPLLRPLSRPPPKARSLTLPLARSSPAGEVSPEAAGLNMDPRSSRALRCCPCGRRLGLLGTRGAALLRVRPSKASGAGPSDPEAIVERFHPRRPDWYEELYAKVLKKCTRSYEAQVVEALPVGDDTMDAVIGTLVLCSVKDIDMALREIKRVLKPGGLFLFIEHVAAPDGSLLRCMQSILDPLQRFVADGCHLTRETGKLISETGFSSVDLNMTVLSSLSHVGPHVYGIARK